MEEKTAPGQSSGIPRSESESMVLGEKRSNAVVGEQPESGRKRAKLLDLESVLRSKDKSQVTTKTVSETIPVLVNQISMPLDLNMEHDINLANPRGFGWDLNAGDVSSSLNRFSPYENTKHSKWAETSECGSTTGLLEERDSMKVWKEMKPNGFLSASHGGIPMPKPRGRKSKDNRLMKNMELAKREQVDRFAKIAAPSGLLNELNPGIINHVRNSKQVHSIIEALVRSEKLENCHFGSKQTIQAKSGNRETNDRMKDQNTYFSHENRSLNTLSQCQHARSCPTSALAHLSSDFAQGDGEAREKEGRLFGKNYVSSLFNQSSEDDILALKLSSSITTASENACSFSTEESANLTSVCYPSVKAASVASQWLELLNQDIKGRLAALRRSKKRVRAVIQTELPLLMSREFSSNQENDPFCMKSSASAAAHRDRWNALFHQIDKALSDEQQQLENWLSQVKEMQLHCDQGLQPFHCNRIHGSNWLGTSETDSRLMVNNPDSELAVRAAAASIYSTCNFIQSMENLPCF